ncbi:ribosome maturation factor RimM [uncultured Cocleimonas sp.]|uniref:ribosome maturation factor RimM n=1 Tax=uncultured Cocleimonas sp. TaxID=1051587 RepID=UPI0026061F0E|nr:ribosome maturation factor RimM [uncultured Cocleimonas sp.]
MSQSNDYIILGEISGVHGIKGWVKVFSHTSPREQITEYKEWFIKRRGDDWKPIKVVDGKKQGKNIIALLENTHYRDQAEAFVGSEIAIHKDQLKELAEGQYYWRDLIGLSVETKEGEKLGIIDWLFDTGSNDVLIVKDTDGTEIKERMLPYIMGDVIQSIDLEKSLMIVDWDPEF